MFHQTHAAVTRPALLVIIANYIFIVRVRVFSQESLDQVPALILHEAEQDKDFIDVAAVESDRVSGFCLNISEAHELVRTVDWPSQFTCSL